MEHATSMSFGEAFWLGLTQGIAEFLPISSSGHLAAGAHFLGIKEPGIGLSVAMHAGTLLATLWLFRKDLFDLSTRFFAGNGEKTRHEVGAILLTTVITAALGLSIKPFAETANASMPTVATMFLCTAAILASIPRRDEGVSTVSWAQAAIIGVAQGLAVMPGISRSGMTIAVAIWLGLSPKGAFRYSFLISLPAVAGALILESRHLESMPLGPLLFGGTIALFSGIVALHLLKGLVNSQRLVYFSPYLLVAAIALFIFG